MRTKRNLLLSVESLEGRDLLTGLAFNITVNDSSGGLVAADPSLTAQVQAVEDYLPTVLMGQGTINVQLVNTSAIGPNVSQGAGSCAVPATVVGDQGGNRIFESAALYEVKTGQHVSDGTPDITVQLRPDTLGLYMSEGQYADDAVETMLLHEITHGLGFGGYRSNSGTSYGTFTGGVESIWDSLTDFGTGGDASVLYFDGPNAESVYGGPVPLTSLGASDATFESFNHLGNPAGRPGAALVGDLMNGIALPQGHSLSIGYSALDLAILSDLGYTTVAKDATPPTVISATETTVGGQDAVVVAFSKPMDPVSAANPDNFGVLLAGSSQPSFGAWNSIRYDASTQSVTLIPSGKVAWSQGDQLVIAATDETKVVDQGGNTLQGGTHASGNVVVAVSALNVPTVTSLAIHPKKVRHPHKKH